MKVPIAKLINELFSSHLKADGQPYTNSEVARALGNRLDATYLSKIRKGQIPNPGRDALSLICEFFQVSPTYFFPELDLQSSPGPRTVRAALRATDLTVELQDRLAELILELERQQQVRQPQGGGYEESG